MKWYGLILLPRKMRGDAPPPDYYAMMQQLYRIGNNLNQIAQKAHTLNVIDVQRYDTAVSQLIDINDDGVEELLLQSEGSPLQTAHDFDENMFLTAIGTRDGELVFFIGGGYLYLCQDNVVEMLSPFEGEEKSHDYYRYDRAFRMEPVDQIHVEDGKLYKWVPNSKISDRDLEEITEAEADAIIAKHPRVDIEFKPAEEFPAQ